MQLLAMAKPRQFVFRSLCLVFLIIKSSQADVRGGTTTCENVTVARCKGVTGYNTTNFPNLFNHRSQAQANELIEQLAPLFNVQCSPVFAFFACTLYIPVCESTFGQQLLPCRSVCKKAKKGCMAVVNQFGYGWPPQMKCSQFPRNVCLSPKYPSMLKNKTQTKTQTKFERKTICRLKTLKKSSKKASVGGRNGATATSGK